MAKVKITAAVTLQEQLAADIYDMRIKAPEIAESAVPGQFVSLYSKDGARILPRPISLCGIDKEKGELRLVYRIAGEGTKEFSGLTEEVGDKKDDDDQYQRKLFFEQEELGIIHIYLRFYDLRFTIEITLGIYDFMIYD